MEIGTQIKQRREAAGLSQEELAEQLYITRQTLSNWETGKTYPDIQSLLRLSDVFHVSLDELVKGDIQAMEEQIKAEDIKKFRRENRVLRILVAVAGMAFVLMAVWNSIITQMLAFAAMLAVILYAYRVDNLQRQYDILTYKEVKAFLEGKRLDELEVAREREKARRMLLVLIFVIALLGIVAAILVPPLLLLLGH